MNVLVHSFFADDKLKIALAVILADFVLGVIAAVKMKTFRLSYVYDFGRNDVLGKLVPWFFLYAGAFYAGHQNLVIPGFDMGLIAGGAYAVMIAAWTGSILSSIRDLGLPTPPVNVPASSMIAGPENAAPPH